MYNTMQDKYFKVPLRVLSLTFFVSLQVTQGKQLFPTNCLPKPKAGASQYIVAYGSLMSSVSKNRTYPGTGENFPITVKGFHRSWNCKGVSPSLSTTYLGVERDPKSSFNAAAFLLANANNSDAIKEALNDFDRRERFYCRKELLPSEIEILLLPQEKQSKVSKAMKDGKVQFWIYVTKPEYTALPSKDYPIVQSYVDTWISGCMEMEDIYGAEDFARKCVKSTGGWSGYWTNDRIFPRRPFVFEPYAAAIDKLLAETVPKEFKIMRNASSNMQLSLSVLLACFSLSLFYFENK